MVAPKNKKTSAAKKPAAAKAAKAPVAKPVVKPAARPAPASALTAAGVVGVAELQSLFELMKSNDIGELALEQTAEGTRLHIVTKGVVPSGSTVSHAPAAHMPYMPTMAPMVAAPPAIASAPAADAPAAGTAPAADAAEPAVKGTPVRSPMVGTFYRSASPDAKSFAEVGDVVSEGSTICIIEAMKMFNEIKSDISGKIVKVLVENGQPVEYNQPLFLVEPN
jgi:acetyl-CoA carboxylase biotin carboxyl carrier protein